MKSTTPHKSALPCLALLALLATPSAPAAVLFADTFDRDDSRNVDASLSGITDNTGSSLAADTVYTHGHIDPNNAPPTYGAQDENAGNGGGARILDNSLELAIGFGTSNAFVNHNFTNASILSDGGLMISLGINGYNLSSNGQGGAFALGMSQADAESAGDSWNGATKMTEAFGDQNATGQNEIADFWMGLRGDSTVAWGGPGNGNIFGTANVGAKTGTISATFTGFGDFSAGTTVDYEVFYNGGAVGSGSFEWSGTNENYIGLDARDNTAVSLDDFSVETVPEPGIALLGGLGLLGLARRRRR